MAYIKRVCAANKFNDGMSQPGGRGKGGRIVFEASGHLPDTKHNFCARL